MGAAGGYGWYHNTRISNPPVSGVAGFPARPAVGVVIGEDPYRYLGGELRSLSFWRTSIAVERDYRIRAWIHEHDHLRLSVPYD